MRVALVQEGVEARRGGAETSTLEMAAALARCGAEVAVISSGGSAEPARGAFEIRAIPVRGASKRARTLAFIDQADERCAAGGFDIVHAITVCRSCNVYQPRGGTFAETIERGLRATPAGWRRLISRAGRRFNARQRDLRRIEEELLRASDPPFVAAVSRYAAQQVLSVAPALPAGRVRVVFNGVDVTALEESERLAARRSVREELALSAEARVGVFVAHNFKLKGLRSLVEAMADGTALSRAEWALLVVGRDDAGPYRRLAQRRGVANRMRWLGPRSDARQLIAAADVLVHPTWFDPCSRVVLEALAMGIPAVTTRWNGAAEVMTPGTHGEIVDTPDDAPRLAHAIEAALRPEVFAGCRADAARMRERLAMTRHAQELLRLYEQVLAAGRRVRGS